MNQLNADRPMLYVWDDELPWKEMNVSNELELKTIKPIYREQELILRKKLYMWKHLRGDMVVTNKLVLKPIYQDSMFGIKDIGRNIRHNDEVNYIKYERQIFDEKDLGKIKIPNIEFPKEKNQKYLEELQQLYHDILDVEIGITRFNFSAWHFIIKWLGTENFYRMINKERELLHKLIEKTSECYMSRLQQYIDLGMVLNNCGNFVCGSGGLSFIEGNESNLIENIWGSSTSQVFEGVPPKIQEELGVDYEIKWLNKFKHTYYGCCETLSDRIDILRKIKNLKKISISPWSDLDKAAERIGKDYVLSYKVSPSLFVLPNWDIDEQRIHFRKILNKMKNCNVEVIVKDNSSVGNHPQRMWQWVKMASEEMNNL